MKLWVVSLLICGLAWGQEKKAPAPEPKKDPMEEAMNGLQKASAELKDADSQMKESALQTQQLTIRFYQKVSEQESKFKAAQALCKGNLLQEDLVWKCKK